MWQERLKKIALPAFLVTASLIIIVVLQPNSYEIINNNWVRAAGYTVLAIMGGASVVISLTHNESALLRRIFRNNILRFFGKYSYAIYLIHPPVMQIILDILWAEKLRGWQAYIIYLFITFSITVVLSFLSWHVLEKRMLSLKKYFV